MSTVRLSKHCLGPSGLPTASALETTRAAFRLAHPT